MVFLSKEGYLAIAICIIVALVIIFVVSFVLYKKTPVPKGCEDIVTNKEKCDACLNKSCPYAKIMKKEK